MDEKELIGKIKELRQIKPNQNWVFLTKNRILGQEVSQPQVFLKPKWGLSPLRLLFLKPAYVGALALFIIVGLFGFAQNSLPGDYLFSIKKMTERSQTFLASDEERAQISLGLVNKRLEELARIVETNQTKKMAPALREFQAAVSEAVPGSNVREVVEIRKRTQELQSLGVVIEESGLQILELESLVGILENLIADLEESSLTAKQEVVLDIMKELVEKGEYAEALELYLRNQ